MILESLVSVESMHIYTTIKTMVNKNMKVTISIIIRENNCSPFKTTVREQKTSDKDLKQVEAR